MQKIFYNARFLTMNKEQKFADAMLTNDDAIVFVGEKQEVLQMKTDETKLVDLKGNFVVPALFDLNLCIFEKIEDGLKNANKTKFIEKDAENDENYEVFSNYDIYKKEFLKIQEDFLKNGITTIQENIVSKQEFVFWKKLAEEKVLKIDVIGYIDFTKNKQIMDDNCRSYRKYKNGFRLGGYYLKVDGSILEKKAWLKNPYPKEHKYSGFSEVVYEQLKFIIKTVLEEKKQLVVYADGNKAVEEFLKCYEDQIKESKVEDNFRPIVVGCNFISKKSLKKMQEFKIVPNYEIDNLTEYYDTLKSYFGSRKIKKMIPFKLKENKNYLFSIRGNDSIDDFGFMKYFSCKKASKIIGKKHRPNVDDLLNTFITNAAYYSFDLEQKGSLESGKKANFLVLDFDVYNAVENDKEINVLEVYSNAELIYKAKKNKDK